MSTTRRVLSSLATATVLSTLAVAVPATPALAATAPTLCVVPSTGGVSRFTLGAGTTWTQIRTTATQSVYGGGGYGVVAVNPSVPDMYLRRAGATTWTKVAGPRPVANWNLKTTDTALYMWLGPSQTSNPIYRYNGTGTAWTDIGSPFRTMYAGNYGLFATNPSTGDIYRYSGSGRSWTLVGGPGHSFAVTNTALYGLSPDRSGIWQYSGSGTSWFNIGPKAFNIYGGGHGLFATFDPGGDLYRYLGTPGNWELLGKPPGGIRRVVVTNNAVFAETSDFFRLYIWEAFDGGGWATIGASQVGSMVACP
jgi:hypothetical protein